ncbi:hypothetical protein [Candidatus Uabimicrobium sp. HlEnr_7]|uniref:hypothetical protein n=1 Tax=Candidatus Uabimicrobium helgolandensis TaxID=3095367 RepID=UPI003557A97C
MKKCDQLLEIFQQRNVDLVEKTFQQDWRDHIRLCLHCRELFEDNISQMFDNKQIASIFTQFNEQIFLHVEKQILSPFVKQKQLWNVETSTAKSIELLTKANNIVLREDLPVAAGSPGELGNIPGSIMGLPDDTYIICQRLAQGYEIHVESAIPVRLTMVFYRDSEELVNINVSEQFLQDLIPFEQIDSWTHFEVLRH